VTTGPNGGDADGRVTESAAVPSAELRRAAAGPLARRLSPKYLEQYCLLPLDIRPDGRLRIAIGGTLDPTTRDELELLFERPLEPVEQPAAEIQAAILSAHAAAPADATVSDLRDSDLQIVSPDEEALDDLRALASQAPVIKLVNLTILEALSRRASDVHLECTGEALRIRHRIDGVLHDAALHAKQYQAAVLSRIKIMANLNIAERRLPQDGRIRLRLSDREVDLRVSTLPTVLGESAVLRVLDRGAGARALSELGMDPATEQEFGRLATRPHGIVLVTGPTGSGKTSTLYAALQQINTTAVKILTVEDPVEYQLEGVTQIPVNPKAGRTFASALRSILRHDPDVIMVGEMRDRETAAVAIQAALTGHLVFSTLHTNDAAGGVTRLIDMGIEPYLVAATVRGLLAQRLIRVVCLECAQRVKPTAAERRLADEAGCAKGRRRFRRGTGCVACAGSGYRGRTGIFELLLVTDRVREAIVHGRALDALRALALEEGMVPLHRAAWAKVCAGTTTLEEVERVTRDESPA